MLIPNKKMNAVLLSLVSGTGGGLMRHMFTTVNYTQYTLPLIHVENGKRLQSVYCVFFPVAVNVP